VSIGQAYSNNGLGFRTSDGSDLKAGEVFFAAPPSPTALAAAFPNYTTAAVAANAQALYKAALTGPLALTFSTSTTLNDSYNIDQATQFNISAELVSILVNGTLTNGLTSRNWPTASGNFRMMTVAQFKAFATAVALYIDQAQTAYATAAAGQVAAWPSVNITVAI
jgi:hypothetical protein